MINVSDFIRFLHKFYPPRVQNITQLDLFLGTLHLVQGAFQAR